MNKVQIILKDLAAEEETILIIKRVRRSDLNNFLKLQRALLEEFVYHNGAAGATVADNKSWGLIEKIAKITPLIPMGFLSDYLELLEENLEVVNSLFFSSSWNPEDGSFEYDEETKSYKPSLLYQLNDLDYTGDVKKVLRNAQMRIQKEEQAEQQKLLEQIREHSETPTKETATN